MIVVPFPTVAGDHERLVAVLRALREELGEEEGAAAPSEAGDRVMWGRADEVDTLAELLREELARLAAAALRHSPLSAADERAVQAALDGAEIVIRGASAAERPRVLEEYLPGFAFLVSLPGLGRSRALDLSERAAELCAGEEPDGRR